jgi:hypothetical protein
VKSVIVATGGFSANSEMVVKYRPDLAGFVTTNHKGATGAGIALLEHIGADTVDMGEIQIHPTVEQNTSYLISESIRGGGAILVNQKGNRFFNEMETRDKVSAQIIALPEHYAYIVFDEHVRAKNKAADEYIARGFVTSASSPRQLAEKLGMDYHAFLATLERYNGFVEQQHDSDFGRTTALRNPINEGPFHAIRIAPGVHHTMGGVTINTETAVLNKQQQVIPGAFAAGEVAGGSTAATVSAVTRWRTSLFLVHWPGTMRQTGRKRRPDDKPRQRPGHFFRSEYGTARRCLVILRRPDGIASPAQIIPSRPLACRRTFRLIKRYEDLFTVNRTPSQVMDINLAAGQHPVVVSRPVFD